MVDDEGIDMLEGNDDETVFVDALKGVLNAFERAVEELYHTTFLAEEVGVWEEGAVIVLPLLHSWLA